MLCSQLHWTIQKLSYVITETPGMDLLSASNAACHDLGNHVLPKLAIHFSIPEAYPESLRGVDAPPVPGLFTVDRNHQDVATVVYFYPRTVDELQLF